MKKEDTKMMLRIFETERAEYAYLYPSDGGERKEDYISPPFSSRNLRTLNSFSQAKHFCPEETPLHHPDFSHGCSLIFFPEILFRYIPAD